MDVSRRHPRNIKKASVGKPMSCGAVCSVSKAVVVLKSRRKCTIGHDAYDWQVRWTWWPCLHLVEEEKKIEDCVTRV